jgi:hypothetical protein
MDQGFYFSTYGEWKDALTIRCGIPLTREYASERLKALENAADPATADFVRCYGENYRRQVATWFQRAAGEAP